ncbi:MAG: rRNA maturation RNase YbeY [Bacteroidetes bacterium]|nr:MAG: rRNA maturation RNase YbeY [Bacteroidota bacterium]
MHRVHFFREDTNFLPTDMPTLQKWIVQVVETEGYSVEELNYIFCSDEHLHKINMEFLKHDTYTDVITFDQSEEENIVEGDIFISIERIRENAETFHVATEEELRRVMVHGVLHLMGYKDKTDEEVAVMREKEALYLNIYKENFWMFHYFGE